MHNDDARRNSTTGGTRGRAGGSGRGNKSNAGSKGSSTSTGENPDGGGGEKMDKGPPEEAAAMPGADVRLAVPELPEQSSIDCVGIGEEGTNGETGKSGGEAEGTEAGDCLGGGAAEEKGVVPINTDEEANE